MNHFVVTHLTGLDPQNQNIQYSLANKLTANRSMWYKWNRVMNMKKEWETTHGMKFDAVILCRMDSYEIPREFTFVKPNIINSYLHGVGSDYGGIYDHWIYGDSNSMDIFANLYHRLDFLRDYYYNLNFDENGVPNKENYQAFETYINPHKLPKKNAEMFDITFEYVH